MAGGSNESRARRLLRAASGLLLSLSAISLLWRPVPLVLSIPATLLLGAAWWSWRRRVPPPQGRRRFGLPEFGLAAASVLLTLATVEIGARVLWPFQPYADTPYVRHPRYFFVPRPDGSGVFDVNMGGGRFLQVPFRFSSQGLRDREFGRKAADEFRVLILGDSFTMGWGLPPEQTIGAQLERMLRGLGGSKRITVINGGVSGYGPFQEAGFLEDHGFALEPDLVLLQIFPANDIENSLAQVGKTMRAYDFGWQRHLLEFKNQNRWPVLAERWLYKHSRAVNAWLASTRRHGAIARFLDDVRFLPATGLSVPGPSAPRPWWIEVTLRDWYPDMSEGFDLLKRDVLGIRRACEARRVPLAVFTLAGGQDFIDAFWSDALRQAPPGTVYERGKEVRIMREFYGANGLREIDVMDALRGDPRPEELYYRYDGHLQPHGAEVVARAIAETLVKDALVPR